MSPEAFVVTWAVQGAVLGLIAVLLARLGRVRHPAMLEWWWQSGAFWVVVMPVLPLLLPSRPAATPLLPAFVEHTVALSPSAGREPLVSPLVALALLWLAGAIARLAWLAVGQRRLRRLAAAGVVDRRRSGPRPCPRRSRSNTVGRCRFASRCG